MQALAFNNYVFDAQRVFRHLMHAMSFPGRIRVLEDDLPVKSGILPEAAAALALTLFDNATDVWLAPTYDICREWLVFQTGCRLANTRKADFAVLPAGDFNDLDGFRLGRADYPDLSTTVIMNGVRFEAGRNYIVGGPGINGEIELKLDGLPDNFMDIWANNRELYPLGIDLILTDKNKMLALPRTTKLKREFK